MGIVAEKTDTKLMLMRSFSSKTAETHSWYDLYRALGAHALWVLYVDVALLLGGGGWRREYVESANGFVVGAGMISVDEEISSFDDLPSVVVEGVEGVGEATEGATGEEGAETGEATEGVEGMEEDEEERGLEEEEAGTFMLSNLFSNHWYNLFLSTGTRVSNKFLHFSSIATILISLGGTTGGGGGTEGIVMKGMGVEEEELERGLLGV
jgi:hypothetical protein